MNELPAFYWILVGVLFSALGFIIYKVSFWCAKLKPKNLYSKGGISESVQRDIDNIKERTFKLEWQDHPLYSDNGCVKSVMLVYINENLLAISSVNVLPYLDRNVYLPKEKIPALIKELIKIDQGANENTPTK